MLMAETAKVGDGSRPGTNEGDEPPKEKMDAKNFNPSLGDQAVRLLDKAISTFRKRRTALLQIVEKDEADLKQLRKDVANCDWHIKHIKGGLAEREERLELVKLQLERFGVKTGDPEGRDASQSIMPILDYAAGAKKHATLEQIRNGMREGHSTLELERGFALQSGLPVHPKDTLPLPAAHIRSIKERQSTMMESLESQPAGIDKSLPKSKPPLV